MPVAIRDYRNGILERDDFAHAGHRLRYGSIDGIERPTRHRGLRDCRREHVRQDNVDAVTGRAVYLGRQIGPWLRGPDQSKLGARLERRAGRRPDSGGFGRQLPVGRGAPRRLVQDSRIACTQLGIGDTETCGRCPDQHLTRRSACDTHAIDPGCARARAAARQLHVANGRNLERRVIDGSRQPMRHADTGLGREASEDIAVGKLVGCRRFLDPDVIEIRLELFREHHRETDNRALTHLAVRHDSDDLVIRSDSHPGRQMRTFRHIIGPDTQAVRRQNDSADAEHEAAAEQTAGTNDHATGPFTHLSPRDSRPPNARRGESAHTCRNGTGSSRRCRFARRSGADSIPEEPRPP